jgi:hypothetical protein
VARLRVDDVEVGHLPYYGSVMFIKLTTKTDNKPVWINGSKIDAVMHGPDDQDGATVAVHGLLMQFKEQPNEIIERIERFT